MKIKKGDKVIVITGKDRGKTGTVTLALPRIDKVVVGGINMLKVHRKPRKSGEKGQVVEQAAPIHVSNVRLAEGKAKKVVEKPVKKEKKVEKKSK